MVVLKVETFFADEITSGEIMALKSNVIDMTARRKAQIRAEQTHLNGRKPKAKKSEAPSAEVLELGARRREILTQERRRNRRTILSNFLGAYIVVPEKGLKEVTLYDISEGGVAFDLEKSEGSFRVTEELAMRVYISKEIYVPITVKVKNVREIADEEVYRHGTIFEATQGDGVLEHFVRFILAMSQNLSRDPGDFKLPSQKG